MSHRIEIADGQTFFLVVGKKTKHNPESVLSSRAHSKSSAWTQGLVGAPSMSHRIESADGQTFFMVVGKKTKHNPESALSSRARAESSA
jgi:hypothetical protein